MSLGLMFNKKKFKKRNKMQALQVENEKLRQVVVELLKTNQELSKGRATNGRAESSQRAEMPPLQEGAEANSVADEESR
jgi:hypothetical protein